MGVVRAESREVILEAPTVDQWEHVVSAFGRPALHLARWERTDGEMGNKHTPRTGNVVMVITDPSSRLVGVRKQNENRWFLPMGGIEEGWDVEDTARKEAGEEAGISIEIVAVPLVYIVDFIYRDVQLTRWHFVVTATTEDRSLHPRDTDEIAEARFFNGLPPNNVLFEKEWMEEILHSTRIKLRAT
jgi:ADP-ribose pyrophosphatase YjhB (NUDIX family)